MGLRTALMFVFRRIARIYFREIEIVGERPTDRTRGRLFAGNHVNGLVDPIVVLTQAPCAISPIAKSTLWKIPGLAWLLDAAGAVPIVRRRDTEGGGPVDNESAFDKVAAHLASGGNILIFPEGTSHNEPHLVELRTGAGRMLARAHEGRPSLDLTFQAVALEFDQRDVFRSRALVLFGPVRRVADMDADVPRAVTRLLASDLSELLVEAETWDDYRRIVRLAEMLARDRGQESLADITEWGRSIRQARSLLSSESPDTVRAIERRLDAYFDAVAREEATDEIVARAEHPTDGPLEPSRVGRIVGALVTLPLAVVGAALYAVPYQLPRFVARRLRATTDVVSTYKLGVGLVAFPAWMVACVILAWAFLSLPLAAAATALVLVSPFATLPWLDRWDRLSGRSSLLATPQTRHTRLAALAREREAILKDVLALGERISARALPS